MGDWQEKQWTNPMYPRPLCSCLGGVGAPCLWSTGPTGNIPRGNPLVMGGCHVACPRRIVLPLFLPCSERAAKGTPLLSIHFARAHGTDGRMEVGLGIFWLHIHHDGLERLFDAPVEGAFVHASILLQQVGKRNGLSGPNAQPSSPLCVVLVIEPNGHNLDVFQRCMSSNAPGQHLSQSSFQRAQRRKWIVVSFGENAHRRSRVQSVDANIKNDVVAFAQLVHPVSLTVDWQLIVAVQNVA